MRWRKMDGNMGTSESPSIRKGQRAAGPELLRLIALFLVVLCHASAFSGIDRPALGFGFEQCLLFFLEGLGSFGVDAFLLITGYYMVGKRFSFKRVFRVYFPAWFYSVSLFAVFAIVNRSDPSFFGAWTIFQAFFPVITLEFWYVSIYILLLFLYPLIELFFKNSTRTGQLIAIFFILLAFGVYPAIPGLMDIGPLADVFLFVFMALVGGYLRRYPDALVYRRWAKWLLFIVPIALYLLYVVLGPYLSSAYGWDVEATMQYSHMRYSLFGGFSALGAFLLIKDADVRSPRLRNAILFLASSVYGAYLVHGNPYMNSFLWKGLFEARAFVGSPWLLPYMLGSAAAVFVVALAVETLRRLVLDRHLFPLLNRPLGRLDLLLYRALDRLKQPREAVDEQK